MKTVVISQPMYFPWVGIFEQIRLADVFVYYDDVQFARGFINRVQCKSSRGLHWLTVPLCKHSRDTRICDLCIKEDTGWRQKHIKSLECSLNGAPYVDDALSLVQNVLSQRELSFSEMLIEGMNKVCEYFNLGQGCQFYKSSELEVDGYKGDRIMNIVRHFNGDRYVTGMGALNYLDHEAFEREGIDVEYMDYKKLPYPQKFGEFTPFVTILDLIANCGRDGRKFICSGTQGWRELTGMQRGK